jgi:hypothetical protein
MTASVPREDARGTDAMCHHIGKSGGLDMRQFAA